MEKKVNENVNEKEIKVIETGMTEERQIVEQEEEKLKLYVERESFVGNDGVTYWAYVLKGKVRGRAVKVDFAPKDKGGYEPLDIVFSIAPTAELIMCNETMTDSKGKTTKYTSYKVRNADALGELECGVKPSRDSDKALLTMMLNELKAGK